MISGTTAWARFSVSVDLTLVAGIVFTYASRGGDILLQKRYPDDTEYREGMIWLPLSQEDTVKLRSRCDIVLVELQVNYKSGAVAKSGIKRVCVGDTLATEYVDGSAPDDTQRDGGVIDVTFDDVIVVQTDGGGITEETDPTVPEWAKEPEKPKYTADEVGALPADTRIPANTSDLINNSGFITRAVNDLVNYYKKSETYTREEVNERVSMIPKFGISVVDALPISGISETTIYLVKSGIDGDLYTEYIYVKGMWEILGSQRVDLTGYATEAWVNGKLADYLPATELPTAINSALAQAKASGEFKGEKGDTGAQGPQGEKGDTGLQGPKGSDATVTAANIESALGFKPASADTVNELSKDITDLGESKQPAGDYALRNELPKNTSELNNDSGYVTIAVATLLNYYLKTETYAKTETYSQTEVDNLISGLDNRLKDIADSDDITLDQLSEIVAYIKSNKSLIDSITTSKVNISDIVNNLTTADAKKPLSAAQGKELKTLYDSLPTWAKAASKPSYSKSEIGLSNVDNVKQYSSSNPPPYPVISVNGKTGAVSLSASDVGAATTAQFNELGQEIADETTAREQAISDLKAQGVQQTPLFAQGDTLEECLAWLDENGDKTKVYAMKKEVSRYLYGYILTKQEVTTGENILSNLSPINGLTLGSNGLCYGYRPSSNNPFYVTAANCNMTGVIPATAEDAPFTFYVKGITSWGGTNDRLGLYTITKEITGAFKLADGVSKDYYTATQIDADYWSFTVKKAYFDYVTWSTVAGIVISFSNTSDGQNIVVSLTPIENITVTGYQWANIGHAFLPADYEDEILALQSRTTSLENRVDELSVGTDGTFTYVAEEAKRVADIVQGNRTVGSLTFTAMSDFHVAVGQTSTWGLENNLTSCRDAGLGLTELQKHLKLDFTAMLGDFTWAGSSELVSQVKKDLSYVKNCMTNGMKDVPNIWCTGNHDINYGANTDRRMTEDEMYAYLTGNNKWTVQDSDNIGRNYGYIDFENQRIRCIYLNTVDAFDYPDNTDGTADDAMEITAVQAQWLVDVGLNLSDKANPTEWGVVILSHHCLCQFQPVTAILTAYKDGVSGSTSITTNGVTTTVNYDFTAANRGEIICAIHGHDHNFTYRKISTERWDQVTEANAWLWSICVPNVDTTRNNEKATSTDEAYKQAFGEFDANGDPVYYPKTQGTAKSTSFCVITIDRKNRKVHAIAYGAGYDREINY